MSTPCTKIIEFLAPQNFYEYLHYPTSISSKFTHFLGDIKSVTTSFAEENIDQYIGYVNPVLYEKNKAIIKTEYIISSNYDTGCYLAICSIFYRMLSLTEASLQHKIAATHWQPHTKGWISTMVAYMPLALIYLSSGPSHEILVACLVEKAVCGVLNFSDSPLAKSMHSFIKDIDLIVKKQPFSMRDMAKQNLSVVARNLSLTLLIVPYLVAPSIQLMNHVIGKEPSGHFQSNAASLDMCNSSITAYSKIPTLYENIGTDLGWVGGKIIVDLFVVLLYKYNVITDLKHPVQGLLNLFDKSKIA